MTEYRVVDLDGDPDDPKETIITGGTSPEGAARDALGLVLYRSGAKANLRAKVYFQVKGGATNMVRKRCADHTSVA